MRVQVLMQQRREREDSAKAALTRIVSAATVQEAAEGAASFPHLLHLINAAWEHVQALCDSGAEEAKALRDRYEAVRSVYESRSYKVMFLAQHDAAVEFLTCETVRSRPPSLAHALALVAGCKPTVKRVKLSGGHRLDDPVSKQSQTFEAAYTVLCAQLGEQLEPPALVYFNKRSRKAVVPTGGRDPTASGTASGSNGGSDGDTVSSASTHSSASSASVKSSARAPKRRAEAPPEPASAPRQPWPHAVDGLTENMQQLWEAALGTLSAHEGHVRNAERAEETARALRDAKAEEAMQPYHQICEGMRRLASGDPERWGALVQEFRVALGGVVPDEDPRAPQQAPPSDEERDRLYAQLREVAATRTGLLAEAAAAEKTRMRQVGECESFRKVVWLLLPGVAGCLAATEEFDVAAAQARVDAVVGRGALSAGTADRFMELVRRLGVPDRGWREDA